MDQVLCKIEHDTPLLYESETGSVQTSHNIDGTLDPYVSDTEIETCTKEKPTRPPNLLDKAFSIDEAILAVPLEPTPVTCPKQEEKAPSSTEDSTSEDDFVVIENTSKDIDETPPILEANTEIMDQIGPEIDLIPADDTPLPNLTASQDEFDTCDIGHKLDVLAGGDSVLVGSPPFEELNASDIPSVYCVQLRNNTPFVSILRRPSSSNNSEHVPDPNSPSSRRVSFPEGDFLVSYREPDVPTPWKIDTDMSWEAILNVYQNSCKRHNTIELDNIKEQIREIKNNTNHSATLNLSSVNITSEVNETLEDILKVSNFNTLVLGDSKFTPSTITEFLNMLEYYESVCHIELRMKFDDEETWKCFCNACSNIKVLESISLKEMSVDENYTRPLIHTVSRNTNITTLKFDGCTLVTLPSFYLIENLINNTTLRELYLPSTGLYTKEAEVLSRFLTMNFYLKVLDISNNFIGDRGFEALSKGLCKQVRIGYGLSVLVVFNNQITEKSGPCISNIIRECKNLHTLNIGFNHLTDEVLMHISASLPETNSLEGLGLQCTLLTCKGIQVLAEAVQKNKTLRKINLKGNKAIQITGVEKLCHALTNTKITKIEIDETNRSCNEADAYKELVKQINEICTINKSLETETPAEDEGSNISKLISRKVSLSCDLRHVVIAQPVVAPVQTGKSRFSISRVSDSNATHAAKPKANRFRVTKVLPSPEEDEPSGKFANVRSSVSSNDSMDSLTALPIDTDSENDH